LTKASTVQMRRLLNIVQCVLTTIKYRPEITIPSLVCKEIYMQGVISEGITMQSIIVSENAPSVEWSGLIIERFHEL
jgi:hypothetical protein